MSTPVNTTANTPGQRRIPILSRLAHLWRRLPTVPEALATLLSLIVVTLFLAYVCAATISDSL